MQDAASNSGPGVPPATASFRLPEEQPLSYCRSLPKDPASGTAATPDKAIILLHGMTHSAAAMMRKARPRLRDMEANAAIYALNAPFFADPEQHRMAARPRGREKSRVWYELPQDRLNAREQLRQPLATSVRHVHQMIDRVREETGLPDERIFLLAFSQGCGPAFQAALERQKPLGGVALLCGNVWDPQMFGMSTPNSKPPMFFAMIDEDDFIPRILYYHSITTMRQMQLPACLHVTPASTIEHTVVERGMLRTIRQRKPSQIEYISGRPHADDPKFAPPGPHDISRPHSIVRFTDTGNGRLRYAGIDMKFRASSHWVNPRIVDALCLWHYDGLVLPQFGMNPVTQVRIPRVSLRTIEQGWALKPRRMDARKPDPLPDWHYPHITFNRLGRRMLHHFCNSLFRIGHALLQPLHSYLYLLPEPSRRRAEPALSPVQWQNERIQETPPGQPRRLLRIPLDFLRKPW